MKKYLLTMAMVSAMTGSTAMACDMSVQTKANMPQQSMKVESRITSLDELFEEKIERSGFKASEKIRSKEQALCSFAVIPGRHNQCSSLLNMRQGSNT